MATFVDVFPAHVGMSRMKASFLELVEGFPRTRGDEPLGSREP